jgi:hypothetical protein
MIIVANAFTTVPFRYWYAAQPAMIKSTDKLAIHITASPEDTPQ